MPAPSLAQTLLGQRIFYKFVMDDKMTWVGGEVVKPSRWVNWMHVRFDDAKTSAVLLEAKNRGSAWKLPATVGGIGVPSGGPTEGTAAAGKRE